MKWEILLYHTESEYKTGMPSCSLISMGSREAAINEAKISQKPVVIMHTKWFLHNFICGFIRKGSREAVVNEAKNLSK